MSGVGGCGPPGERVLPASRRPDGTLRKEIRIRAGFVPQDEVAVYVAKGTQPRSSGPSLPPGLDPKYAAQAAASAKSKAARKNDRRREKRAASREGSDAGHTQTDSTADVKPEADMKGSVSVEASLAELVLDAGPSCNSPAALEAAAGDGQKGDLEKRIRALRKKMRQVEELRGKVALTPEETQKLARVPQLESELASLSSMLAQQN